MECNKCQATIKDLQGKLDAAKANNKTVEGHFGGAEFAVELIAKENKELRAQLEALTTERNDFQTQAGARKREVFELKVCVWKLVEAGSKLSNGADLYQRQYIAGSKGGIIDWDASLRRDIDDMVAAITKAKRLGIGV